MKKANSVDPAKFAPEMFNVSFKGATGQVEFDAKGDRKNAEMTIFKLQNGKVVPIAIVKNGETTPFTMPAAGGAAAAPAAAPATGSAAPAKETPKKDEANKGEAKPAETKKDEGKK